MRTLPTMALVLLACGAASGCADSPSRASGAGATPTIPAGADPIILRVARAGGLVSAFRYPELDSALWKSNARAPALDRVIAFGAEDGYLAAIDTSGGPVRIDLRLGAVAPTRATALTTVSSADGADIYALTATGQLTRFTTSGGDWLFTPPLPANALFAQSDGSVIVAGSRGKRVLVWRVRPPGQGVSDSVSFDIDAEGPRVVQMIASTAGVVGDRVFFGANETVIAVRSRDMGAVLNVDMGDPIAAIAATPSGDRLFVALENDATLRIVDRFEEGVTAKVRLPSAVRTLRMDPLGRIVLARGAGDSVYVISVATGAVAGMVHTDWRGDLPLVLPDGAVAMARGNDVVLADWITYADGRKIPGGGRDFWYAMRWNGFRPRAAGLDRPVEFRRGTRRDPPADSNDSLVVDSVVKAPIAAPPAPSSPRAEARAETRVDARAPRDSSFTVSFATMLDQHAANKLAGRIRVTGQRARVTTSTSAGKPLYRVVMGPFTSREQAELVGRTSNQSYWVFEGTP